MTTMTMEAYMSLVAGDAQSLETLVGQNRFSLRVQPATAWLYEAADHRDFLVGFVRPRVALAEAVYRDPLATLATLERARAYAARVRHEYQTVRALLLSAESQYRGHSEMTVAQRTGFLQLFLCSLVAEHAVEVVRCQAAGCILPVDDEAAELPYAAATLARTDECITRADRYTPFSRYTLDEWFSSLMAFTRTLNLHGDQILPRAPADTVPDPLLVTWRALWSRLATILMGDLRPAERTDPYFLPTNAGLGSLFTDPEDDPQQTERTKRHHHPLPIVAGGQRLRTCFLTTVEIVYAAHERRFASLRAFKAAADAHTAVAALISTTKTTPTACAAAMIALVKRLIATRPPLLMRFLVDRVYPHTLPLSWVWCEDEERVIADNAEHSGRDRLIHAVGAHVAPRNPDDVVRATRPVDFRTLSELADDKVVLDHVVEHFFVGQEGTEANRAACPMERIAVPLLVRILDGMFSEASVARAAAPSAGAYIDEVAQFGPAAAKEHPLPASPAEAFERYGKATGVALVRLMRRTFVVTAIHGRPGPPVTVELPSFLLGLCFWMARVHAHLLPLDHVPSELRTVVQALRR